MALRWNNTSKNAKKLAAGDVIPFVICNEPPPGVVVGPNQRISHTQRAYHAEEVLSSDGELTIDKQYYLAEQAHKVVTRICEFVDGLDSVIIADCLGVDRTLFPHHFIVRAEEEEAVVTVNDNEMYKNCLPLIMICPATTCGALWEFYDPIVERVSYTLTLSTFHAN